MNRRIRVVAILATLLVIGGAASAQDVFELSLTSAETTLNGTAVVAVEIDADGDLQGWQWGVCHADDSIIAILSGDDVVQGSATEDLDFTFEAILAFAEEDGPGWTIGALLNPIVAEVLPAGNDLELYLATYTSFDTAGTVDIEFCDTLNSPPVSPEVVVDNEQITPTTVDGQISVIEGFPYTLKVDVDPATVVAQGASIDIPAMLTVPEADNPVDGFSFGIEHDDTLVAIDAVEQGAALADFNEGDGPSFFSTNLEPDGGAGFTVGCVFSFGIDDGSGGTIFEQLTNAEDPYEILMLSYTVELSAPQDSVVSLDFTGNLGAPRVPIVITTGGASDATVTLETGTFTIFEAPEPVFIRGDGNADGVVDISDAFYIALALFGDGDPILCEDAADADDSESLGILDSMYILDYLFLDGDEPPAPFGECDEDTTGDDSLICETTQAPTCP